jgi:hypothetical protein
MLWQEKSGNPGSNARVAIFPFNFDEMQISLRSAGLATNLI